jgi:zinc protease
VGSFDVAAIKRCWRPTWQPADAGHPGGLPRLGIRPVQGVVKKEVNSGSEDKSTVSLTFTGATGVNELEELRLSAWPGMNIRIIDCCARSWA